MQQALDARQQRTSRERAVAIVGPVGRDFVETYGQDAVAAIFACRQPVAQQLTEFHASGDLARLPRRATCCASSASRVMAAMWPCGPLPMSAN